MSSPDDALPFPMPPEAPSEGSATLELSPRRGSLWVNYASLLGGTIFTKGLAFVTVIFLTRYLGVNEFGVYSLVFSYWALLNTLVDFGVSGVLGREIAHVPKNPRPSLESAIYIRLLGCLVFLPLGFVAAGWVGLSPMLAGLVILGILVGSEAFYEVYFSATMQLHHNAQARVWASVIQALLTGLAIWQRWPLWSILLISLLNPAVKLLLDRYYGGAFRWTLNPPNWLHIRTMMRDSWPLWFAGLQYIVLARVDTVMLQMLSPTGAHDLGIYAAAFRFSEVMALLINALCPALLPLLVAHRHQAEALRFLTETGLRLILTALIVLSILLFSYAPWIVKLYGPGYEPAVLCMRILIGSQALVAVNVLCYQLLLIYNAQGRRPVLLGGTLMMCLNIALNLWWIPSFHAEGASWATLITELATVLLMLWFVRCYTPLRLAKDWLYLEFLMALSSFPMIVWGDLYGIVSVILFIALVFIFRLLTPSRLQRLAQARLPESPNP